MSSGLPSPPARGVRRAWRELPLSLRLGLERELGARVVRTRTVAMGFSPGVAAKVTLSDGRRAFVKGVTGSWNQQALEMHRREAEVTRALPATLPAPRLLAAVSEGQATALALELVPGRPPRLPWRLRELGAVLEVLTRMARLLTPSPISAEPAGDLGLVGFRSLLQDREAGDDRLPDLPQYIRDHLEELGDGWAEAVDGQTLCHFDLRQDNLLLGPGGVSVVDWPSVVLGTPWLDLVTFLPSVAAQGGPPPWELFDEHPLGRDAPRPAVAAAVCAVTGYFWASQRLPPAPGIPTLRPFQLAQAGPALRWLRRLLEG